MKYKLLKSTPVIPAGTVFEEYGDRLKRVDGNGYYMRDEVLNFSEWFAPIDERWKPQRGQTYWVVDFEEPEGVYEWISDVKDVKDTMRYNFGNCFRTREEAVVAAEKVKALLLSLHKNN